MEAAARMTVETFYGRDNGLRLDGKPYLTVCREQDAPPETISTDCQPKVTTRADGRSTAEVMDEIARRWNAHAAMLAALEAAERALADLVSPDGFGTNALKNVRDAVALARGEVVRP